MASFESSSENTEPLVSIKLDQVATDYSKDGNVDSNLAFHMKLPEEGLALRGARVVDDIPELLFEPSPKVPTIQEEDVATAFRLASENERPGFYYNLFPFTHPLHESRLFMQYSPAWLRWTAFGKLLADADWNMKCLHVGARTNDEKDIFKSWPKFSQLNGLATHLDFPKDGLGPTIMSCDYTTMEKGDDEIRFPEEPKMKITDNSCSSYSEYITMHYNSVAYHDEPKFLKVQELFKLVLATEWLYKEKGIRMNPEWVLKHTAKPTDKKKAEIQLELATRKKPPSSMIPPQPAIFERPLSDLSVNTWNSEMYDSLQSKCGVERRYGYLDFGGAEMIMFKEDGTKCPPQKCLKLFAEFHSIHILSYIPLTEQSQHTQIFANIKEGLLTLLPINTHLVLSYPMPMSVHCTMEDSTDASTMELKIRMSFYFHPPLALPPQQETMTIKATVDKYDKLFSSLDPNEPIQPEIPGLCEAIVPDVNSWEELISELSVPIPRVWHHPFVGLGEPTATGGVTTNNFRVREEPLRRKVVSEESEVRDNYKRSGPSLVVRAANITAQGKICLLSPQSPEFSEVLRKFIGDWTKGNPPVSGSVSVFAITNSTLEKKWVAYRGTLEMQASEQHYHGTELFCDILSSQKLCQNGKCSICGISSAGMDPNCIRKNIDFQRFGHGFYLAPHSSKCHDYTEKNARGHRAMILCEVLPGKKYPLQHNSQNLTGPPSGYDSVYGQVGSKLNYPEIVVYNQNAVMPRYIIVYSTA